MRRVIVMNLLLCALLAIQQPSVVVRSAAWQQGRALTNAQPGGPGSVVEEEKLPGMRECRRPRLSGVLASGGGHRGPVPSRPPALTRTLAPALPGHDIARGHWRAALLPPRPLLDDDPPSVA